MSRKKYQQLLAKCIPILSTHIPTSKPPYPTLLALPLPTSPYSTVPQPTPPNPSLNYHYQNESNCIIQDYIRSPASKNQSSYFVYIQSARCKYLSLLDCFMDARSSHLFSLHNPNSSSKKYMQKKLGSPKDAFYLQGESLRGVFYPQGLYYVVLGRDVLRQYWYALGKELLISLSRHSLTCTIQPWISLLWQKYSSILDVYNSTERSCHVIGTQVNFASGSLNTAKEGLSSGLFSISCQIRY